MDNIVVGRSSEAETLVWLVEAFAYTIRHDQTKLRSYLEAVSEEVVFEMGLDTNLR